MNRALKVELHPRNRFRGGYDFPRLIEGNPLLAAFVKPNAFGDLSIDYAHPAAVKVLNQALLLDAYGLRHWDIPPGCLCPPIPGRSDYLHHLADLLADGGAIPRGGATRVLDVGMGANAIYPLIGASEYGWSFVGSELDAAAWRWAGKMVAANPSVAGLIECRLQKSAVLCFEGIVQKGERFDLTMCNPPFHSSADEAAAGTRRKLRHLGGRPGVLNFGGQAGELWCEGGELGFIRRMITQSRDYSKSARWFTTLVSKSANLPRLEHALRQVKVAEIRIIGMAQGQKKSRILAWRFEAS